MLPTSLENAASASSAAKSIAAAGREHPRVLYLTDLSPVGKFGSMEEQIFELARAVRDQGGAVLPVFGTPLDSAVVDQYGALGLDVAGLNLHQFNLSSAFQLLALVRENDIEIAHWNFYSPINPYVWFLSIFAPRLRHFLTDHTSRALPLERAPRGAKRLLKKLLFLRYKKVLCISDFVVDCLHHQATWSNVSRCTYFINTERFHPRPEIRAMTRTRLKGKGQEKFIMLFVGRLIPEKGCDVGIRSLADLPESVVLWIVGEGDALAMLRSLAESLGVAHRVRFLGKQRNVEPYMQSADCLVCPSLWGEATGLVNLEALACGLPVVASTVGGIPEFVQHERTGLLFAPSDHVQLATQIQRLRTEPDLARRLSHQGRTYAVEQFSIARRIPEYVHAYRS